MDREKKAFKGKEEDQLPRCHSAIPRNSSSAPRNGGGGRLATKRGKGGKGPEKSFLKMLEVVFEGGGLGKKHRGKGGVPTR